MLSLEELKEMHEKKKEKENLENIYNICICFGGGKRQVIFNFFFQILPPLVTVSSKGTAAATGSFNIVVINPCCIMSHYFDVCLLCIAKMQ